MKTLSNNIIKLIEIGYEAHCSCIQTLVNERLNSPAEEIFSRYFKEQRDSVNDYCKKTNIDLLAVLEANNIEVKRQVGLALIEDELRFSLGTKSKYDSEFQELGITKKVQITNGIENAPWLALFNSPVSLQWWSKNTSKVMDKLSCTDKQFNYISTVVERIKANWIDPQQTRPDREAYWQLMELKVTDEIKQLILKQPGY